MWKYGDPGMCHKLAKDPILNMPAAAVFAKDVCMTPSKLTE